MKKCGRSGVIGLAGSGCGKMSHIIKPTIRHGPLDRASTGDQPRRGGALAVCVTHTGQVAAEPQASIWTSNQVRGPAEFKHIIKRRKRN